MGVFISFSDSSSYNSILNYFRLLNPMYEGSMQHDAQEFLRCFLCYLQDADKTARNFSIQIQNTAALKVTVNPVMQRFLQSARKEEKKLEVSGTEEVKNGCNKNYDDRTDKKCEGDVNFSVNSAKVNLFAQLQSLDKTEVLETNSGCFSKAKIVPTESCPQNFDKMLPKIGSTAENIFDKASDNLAGLLSANMAASAATNELSSECKMQTLKVHKKVAKSDKRSREQAAHDICETSKKKICPLSSKVSNGAESKVSNKKLTQPSITEMYYKTYSKKKRLGMSSSIKMENAAARIFDQLQELEETHKDGKSMETDLESECNKENQQLASLASLPDLKDTTETSKTIRETKSDSCILDMDNSKTLEYSHHVSAFYSSTSSTGEDLSDSDDNEEDIIHLKKNAKHLYNSPRRSPRKSNSQMLIPSPALINKSIFSHSESDIKSLKLNLDSKFDSVSNSHTSNSSKISEADCILGTRAESDTMETKSPDRIIVDCDITFKKQKTEHPSDDKMALEPVILLENCDHVFKNNETSVSATFATKCLSPSKRTPKKESYSSNYLKQRSLLDSMEYENTEALQEALEAMFNSPGKSKSKYDFIEGLFQVSSLVQITGPKGDFTFRLVASGYSNDQNKT